LAFKQFEARRQSFSALQFLQFFQVFVADESLALATFQAHLPWLQSRAFGEIGASTARAIFWLCIRMTVILAIITQSWYRY
jgi:uncharacterized membrane protein (DUF485 family)